MTNFTTRPDRLKKMQNRLDDQLRLNSQLTIELIEYQNQLKQLEHDPESVASYTELCEQLECAQDKASDEFDCLIELKSKRIRDRFCDKNNGFELYCHLLTIQTNCVIQCNQIVADIHAQMFAIHADEVEAEKDEAITGACEALNKNPITDWKCQKYIDKIVGDKIESTP